VLCTDSLSSSVMFVSSVWASLPEIKRWNGMELNYCTIEGDGSLPAGSRETAPVGVQRQVEAPKSWRQMCICISIVNKQNKRVFFDFFSLLLPIY